MTVSQQNVIDWLGLQKGSGRIVLTIVDDLDWTQELEHLALLQGKVNRYMDFIESGEVYERLDEKLGRQVAPETPIAISILAKHRPSVRGEEFLEFAATELDNAGVRLSFKILEPD